MTNEEMKPTPPESPGSGPQDGNGHAASDWEAKAVELEQQLKDEKNKYLYLYADFDNFKKRAVKERSDLIKFGWENVARELVGVLDNLDRALGHLPPNLDENFKMGIQMVENHFRSTLEKQGVAEIKAKGASFNPELHEAMGQEPSSEPQGTITQVLTKGYTLHGRLLRPARVVVSAGTANAAPSEGADGSSVI